MISQCEPFRLLVLEDDATIGIFRSRIRENEVEGIVLESCGTCFTHVSEMGVCSRQLVQCALSKYTEMLKNTVQFRNLQSKKRPVVSARFCPVQKKIKRSGANGGASGSRHSHSSATWLKDQIFSESSCSSILSIDGNACIKVHPSGKVAKVSFLCPIPDCNSTSYNLQEGFGSFRAVDEVEECFTIVQKTVPLCAPSGHHSSPLMNAIEAFHQAPYSNTPTRNLSSQDGYITGNLPSPVDLDVEPCWKLVSENGQNCKPHQIIARDVLRLGKVEMLNLEPLEPSEQKIEKGYLAPGLPRPIAEYTPQASFVLQLQSIQDPSKCLSTSVHGSEEPSVLVQIHADGSVGELVGDLFYHHHPNSIHHAQSSSTSNQDCNSSPLPPRVLHYLAAWGSLVEYTEVCNGSSSSDDAGVASSQLNTTSRCYDLGPIVARAKALKDQYQANGTPAEAMDQFHLSLPNATMVGPSAFFSAEAVWEEVVPGQGSFVAFADGRCRARFLDRTLLELRPLPLLPQRGRPRPPAAAGEGAAAAAAPPRPPPTLSARELAAHVLSARGRRAAFLAAEAPPALRAHAAAAVAFRNRVYLTRAEREGRERARRALARAVAAEDLRIRALRVAAAAAAGAALPPDAAAAGGWAPRGGVGAGGWQGQEGGGGGGVPEDVRSWASPSAHDPTICCASAVSAGGGERDDVVANVTSRNTALLESISNMIG